MQGYREDDGLFLESDTDEQLLIHIPFNTACKLSGLIIKSSGSEQVHSPPFSPPYHHCRRGSSRRSVLLPPLLLPLCLRCCCRSSILLRPLVPPQAPKRVKLFVNRPTMGFSEAADSAGLQEFDLGEKELAGEQLPLKCVGAGRGGGRGAWYGNEDFNLGGEGADWEHSSSVKCVGVSARSQARWVWPVLKGLGCHSGLRAAPSAGRGGAPERRGRRRGWSPDVEGCTAGAFRDEAACGAGVGFRVSC